MLLIGTRSCGHAETTTMQSICARNVTESPARVGAERERVRDLAALDVDHAHALPGRDADATAFAGGHFDDHDLANRVVVVPRTRSRASNQYSPPATSMPAAHEKSVFPSALAIGPCSGPTSPNSHAQPAARPRTSAIIAGQFTSPYGERSAGSYRAGTSTFARRRRKYSTSVIPAHGLIQTTIETIQLSNEWAKLSDWMNAISTPLPITPAIAVIFQRAVFRPIESAASEHEYRLRMLVAIGPWRIRRATGTAI